MPSFVPWWNITIIITTRVWYSCCGANRPTTNCKRPWLVVVVAKMAKAVLAVVVILMSLLFPPLIPVRWGLPRPTVPFWAASASPGPMRHCEPWDIARLTGTWMGPCQCRRRQQQRCQRRCQEQDDECNYTCNDAVVVLSLRY